MVHQWFEEAIAETHSLYVLDVLAERWKTDAPYSNWIDYASAIREYYDDRVLTDDMGLSGTRLAEYYKTNRDTLEQNPYTTAEDGERIVHNLALVLYEDVFRNDSTAWEAFKTLHSIGRCENLTFEEYMNEWYAQCG